MWKQVEELFPKLAGTVSGALTVTVFKIISIIADCDLLEPIILLQWNKHLNY